jgi:hypothetical protein
MDIAALKCWKAFCEIRYPPSPDFMDCRGKLVSALRSDTLTEWRIDPARFIVHDKDKRRLLHAAFQSSVITTELPENLGHFRQQAEHFLVTMGDTLTLTKLTRIGVRFYYLLPCPSFEPVMESLRDRLCQITMPQRKALGGDIVDVSLGLTLRYESDKGSLFIGPMVREELQGRFESDATKSDLPDAAVWADFDYYCEAPVFASGRFRPYIHQFLDQACSVSSQAVGEFLQQLGG